MRPTRSEISPVGRGEGGASETRPDDLPGHARQRVLIESPSPVVDDGRYPVKRVLGDQVEVSIDLLCDGHDKLAGVVRHRLQQNGPWHESALAPIGNDRWQGRFIVDALGVWEFAFAAWVDEYASWVWALDRKVRAGQHTEIDFIGGALLVQGAATRAAACGANADAKALSQLAAALRAPGDAQARFAHARGEEARALLARHPDRQYATHSDRGFPIIVEPERARFSAWYELFPRSQGQGGRHGTFADVERLLPYVAGMGFDVLYLPPIHPIGRSHRKGPNNSLQAGPDDPGSPWAIGSAEGGHRDFHPQLGGEADFRRLVDAARGFGVEVALDIAFQVSPDHPYVRSHPEWFVRRPDGSVQYAENPPKKYQDIYPFDLAGEFHADLWCELRDVLLLWIDRGVRVFRVDNPHTKPIRFWQWCLGEVKRRHPDVIFLSEAFTRPKLMYALAKVGFSQSYTYFTWRTGRFELAEYLAELTRAPVKDFFRPNFWVNTPDILPEHLWHAGPPCFVARLVLAGTLTASYGIYGPAFELMENVPRPGTEEYLDNEKYQLRAWQLDRADSLRPVITRLNRIRRENRALQSNDGLVFHRADNDYLLCYSKTTASGDNVVVTVVNLDPQHRHAGWIDLDVGALGVGRDETYQAHDLLSDARYQWSGARVFVDLDPHTMPAQIFRLRRRARSEQAFEYFV